MRGIPQELFYESYHPADSLYDLLHTRVSTRRPGIAQWMCLQTRRCADGGYPEVLHSYRTRRRHQEQASEHRLSIAITAQAAGRVKKKVDPSPGVDSSQTRPPCRSMIFLTTARPIPVPACSSRV
jgi:hypothetical protein